RAIRCHGVIVVSADSRCGAVGSNARDQHDGTVGQPDEHALLRSGPSMADGRVSSVPVLAAVSGAGQGFTPAVDTVENWTGRLFRASRRRAAGSRRVGAATGGLPYAEQRR